MEETQQEKILKKLEKHGGKYVIQSEGNKLEIISSYFGKYWIVFNGRIKIYEDQTEALDEAVRLKKLHKL